MHFELKSFSYLSEVNRGRVLKHVSLPYNSESSCFLICLVWLSFRNQHHKGVRGFKSDSWQELIFAHISESGTWMLRENGRHSWHKNWGNMKLRGATRLYSPLHASLELARGSQQDLGPSFVSYHSYWYSFSAQSLYLPKRCLSSHDQRRGGHWYHSEGLSSVKKVHDNF